MYWIMAYYCWNMREPMIFEMIYPEIGFDTNDNVFKTEIRFSIVKSPPSIWWRHYTFVWCQNSKPCLTWIQKSSSRNECWHCFPPPALVYLPPPPPTTLLLPQHCNSLWHLSKCCQHSFLQYSCSFLIKVFLRCSSFKYLSNCTCSSVLASYIC